MLHPEVMRRLAKDRFDAYEREAKHDRLVREVKMAAHEEPRERFRVRDLRWVMFRPLGA